MVLVLKKGASIEEIRAIEKIVFKNNSAIGFDAEKYSGIFTLANDPIEIHKKLRNEWNRS